ncbi:MAG: hypothetical protein ABI988_14685 [Nitrospirota bacterium]
MIETDSETPKSGSREVRVTLSALRDVVKTIAAEEAAETRAWTRLEPQLVKRPARPAITEIPDILPGAGPTSTEPNAPATSRPGRRK